MTGIKPRHGLTRPPAAPDLDAIKEEFLVRFGMIRAERAGECALHARHRSPRHIHVTEKGDPKFVGFAYRAAGEIGVCVVAQGAGRLGHQEPRRAGRRRRIAAGRFERLSGRGRARDRRRCRHYRSRAPAKNRRRRRGPAARAPGN